MGEQLVIDIQKYQTHLEFETLICFVYEPEGRIDNPIRIESDLSKDADGFKVKVYVKPTGL